MEGLKHSRRKHRVRGKSNSLPPLLLLRASIVHFSRMEDMDVDEAPVLLSDMRSFFEDCCRIGFVSYALLSQLCEVSFAR